MADELGVVGQADVSGVVLVVVAARGGGLVADDEGALDVDAHVARVQDGVVDVGLGSGASRTCGHAVHGSSTSGIGRRGVRRVSAGG